MNSKKRILLIGHNFWPELTGVGKYNGEMIMWLANNGYACTVVTTYPYYPHWKVQAPYKNNWYKKEILSFSKCASNCTVYRCPLYVPKFLTGKTRILHDFSFLISIFFIILKLILFNKKYDYIISIAPPFHLGYLSRFYRKFRGGKIIYHIQDLQIEAAQELAILKGKLLFNFLYKTEKYLLKGGDVVSSISCGMIKNIKSKVDRSVIFFPNWVEISQFFPIKDKVELKKEFGCNEDQFICLYSGSIGEKQGLENIIYAAEILKGSPKIKFLICGTGLYKIKLQELVLSKKLDNVTFLPLQTKEKFNALLNIAHIHLIIQKSHISDFVLPSKLSTILSVGGVSLVTTNKNTSLYELVEKFDVGFIVAPDDYVKLAETISILPSIDISSKQNNARKYALHYLDIDKVMKGFLANIVQ